MSDGVEEDNALQLEAKRECPLPGSPKTLTFSLPPEMEAQVRQVMKDENLSVSELLRQAIRLFMDEREWRTRERLERLRSRQTEQEETRRTDR